jgi:hypothetical protein
MRDSLESGRRQLRLLERQLGRRDVLRGAGSIAIAAPLLIPFRIPPEAFEIDMDGEPNLRSEALLPRDQFLAHYEPALRTRKIHIGTSFCPEYFGAAAEGSQPGREELAMRVLRACVEDLGMTDIRLGLRWTNLAPDGVTLTSFYKPYLDYLFRHPSVRQVVLDIGPLKTFRWPEIHVPKPVIEGLRRVPSKTATITPDMEIARHSLAHAQRTIEYLGSEYDGAKPVAISLNEPFHGFGKYEWVMGEAYLEQLLDVIFSSGYFEGAGLIINSAQGLDLDRIADFFADLVRKRPEFKGRLTSGFDIYPFLPPVVNFPVLREILANIRRTIRDWDDQVTMNLRRARHPEYGYRIEITEAQAEPFGQHKVVGNSLPHYQHVLAQCIDRILDPQQDESVIRIFGAEYQLRSVFEGTATDANREILALTRAINALHAG